MRKRFDIIRKRHELNMTQMQLAQRIGCHHHHVSSMETGRRKVNDEFYRKIMEIKKT